MLTLREYAHAHVGDDDTSQRRRDPETVVGERARVEADHQFDFTEVFSKRVEMKFEVRTPTLLARFNQDDASSVSYCAPFELLEGE